MSNAKALSLVLGLILSSSALAAPISNDDVTLHLEGAAVLSNGFYSAKPDAKVVLDIEAGRGEFLWIYAVVADPSGKPDLGTLVLVHSQIVPTGQAKLGFSVPSAPEGSIILIGAVVWSAKGLASSKPIGMQISGSEILYAPSGPQAGIADPPLTLGDE